MSRDDQSACQGFVDMTDQALRELILAGQAEQLARKQRALSGAEHASEVIAIDYSGDDFPRAGCKLVIEIGEQDYSWRVYAPGMLIEAGRAIESYMPRPMASIGIAIDAFAHGATVRSVLIPMSRAERESKVNRQSRDPSSPDIAR